MNPQDLVVRFFHSLGRQDEARYYLELFGRSRESFALIRAGAELATLGRDALTVDLQYLAALDLHPIIAVPSHDQVGDYPGDCRVAASLQELTALATAAATRKIVLLAPTAGIGPSLIDVTTELDKLLPNLQPEQQALLRDADALLRGVPHRITVAITSPLALLQELFTERGAGTLVRRGAVITRNHAYDALDRDQLNTVMHSAFGRAPATSFYDRAVQRIYVAGDYDGVAITAPTALAPYLSKFAVDQRARGEGTGRDLWRALVADCNRLMWRCRPDNPIAAWYQQQCDGMARAGRWVVYWRGLEPHQIPAAIATCAAVEDDFGTLQ